MFNFIFITNCDSLECLTIKVDMQKNRVNFLSFVSKQNAFRNLCLQRKSVDYPFSN